VGVTIARGAARGARMIRIAMIADRHRGDQETRPSGRFRRSTAQMGRRGFLRLDPPQPATGQRFRGDPRFSRYLPLCGLGHADRQSVGPIKMSFEFLTGGWPISIARPY
jgi:hypothetical protein